MTLLYLFLLFVFACIFGYYIYDEENVSCEWCGFLKKIKFFRKLEDGFLLYIIKFWVTVLPIVGFIIFIGKLLSKVFA